jgi:hypothetical protein
MDRKVFVIMMKKTILSFGCLALLATACDNDADVASRNLSQAADNFKINRRIVFYNGVTGDYMLTIEGLCSQVQTERKLAVTCKVGPDSYKKHFLGLSDNVTYFSEQMDDAKVSVYHYKVTFKPSVIIPYVDVR